MSCTEVSVESVVVTILDRFSRNPAKLIPILQAIQEELRYLPKSAIAQVARALDLPPARVYGVATFYAHFALEPKGKYVFRVCDGTACHVKGSRKIFDALQEKLGVSEDAPTTEDMLFTIERVSCLGACGLAPVMLVNEDVYGQVGAEKALEIVEQIRTDEQG